MDYAKRMRLKAFSRIISVVIMVVGLLSTPFATQVSSQTSRSSPREDVIIGFTQTPGKRERAIVRAHGGRIKYSYHLVPAVAASIPESAREGLLQNPNVTGVDLDGRVYAVDTELNNSWGVKRINTETAHNGGDKGTGVKVAIIDSGVDTSHPDLDENVVGGYDFVEGDSDPSDVYGHGTHVAGSACGEDNDNGVNDPKLGIVGVAPECALYSLRVLNDSGSGSWSDVIAALQWAVDNKIQVANLSLGSSQDPGSTVQQAFDNAEAKGVFIAAAAGNSGNPPGRGNSVIYPAKYASVVAVSATDINDERPRWSSTGEEVELAAPGVSVYSAWNDADSPHDPQPVCGTDAKGKYGCYKYGSGTSMASPHVAGVAALVIGAGVGDADGDGLVNDEVRSILTTTAEDIGPTGKDEHYGYGLVDSQAAVDEVGSVDQLPTVSITDPKEGDVVSGSIPVTADASDDNGVTQVEFFADNVSIGVDSDGSDGWTASWDTTSETEGDHTITATATDTGSQTSSDSVNVTVNNFNDLPVAEAGEDQIVIDSDGDGSEPVTLDGTGSYDPDGTIASYEWMEDGNYLGSGETFTYGFALGAHTVTLTVTDDDGASASDDVIITVEEASGISLTATGYKFRGLQKADLQWFGAVSAKVDVKRDGALIATTENNEFYTDNIDQRGSGTYVYQVCEEEASICSNESTVSFN